MAKVGAQRAAELTGKSKSTIQRAMNSGKLSYEKDINDRKIIDVSELERVYGLMGSGSSSAAPVSSQAAVEAELKKASDMIEMERMKMKIKALEDQLEMTNQSVEDIKAQRDQWQKQAQQVLITSQYSQKQAEEYKAELKSREESARKRREQREKSMSDKNFVDRMQNLEGQNQNKSRPTNNTGFSRPNRPGGQDAGRKLTEQNLKKTSNLKELMDVQSLWKKIKGGKAA